MLAKRLSNGIHVALLLDAVGRRERPSGRVTQRLGRAEQSGRPLRMAQLVASATQWKTR